MTTRSLAQAFHPALLLMAFVAALAVTGWMLNTFKLMTTALPLAQWSTAEALRVVGVVVAPLGALVGYF